MQGMSHATALHIKAVLASANNPSTAQMLLLLLL
jgi:hypothetical protein